MSSFPEQWKVGETVFYSYYNIESQQVHVMATRLAPNGREAHAIYIIPDEVFRASRLDVDLHISMVVDDLMTTLDTFFKAEAANADTTD